MRKHEWKVEERNASKTIYLCIHCGEVKIERAEKVSYAEGGENPKICKLRKEK